MDHISSRPKEYAYPGAFDAALDGPAHLFDLGDGVLDHRVLRQRFHRVALHAVVFPAFAQFQQFDRRGTDVQTDQRRLLFSEKAQNSPLNIL